LMITAIFATVLAASMAGQTAVGRVPGAVALPAGCAGLVAGMGLLALGLGVYSLACSWPAAWSLGLAKLELRAPGWRP
jgi:hypothetical protein